MSVWLRSFVSPFYKALLDAFETIARIEDKGKSALVITRIFDGTAQVPVVLENGDNDPNAFLLTKDLLTDVADRIFAGTGIWRRVYGLNQYMVQSLMPKEILYICGAGHVGYQLGRMAHIVDFSTVVMDDRPEFADPLRFPHAREVKVVPGFTPIFNGFEVNIMGELILVRAENKKGKEKSNAACKRFWPGRDKRAVICPYPCRRFFLPHGTGVQAFAAHRRETHGLSRD